MSQQSNNPSATGAVLNEQQFNAITQAISGLNRDQLTWISGYAAGMAAAQGGAVAATADSAVAPAQTDAPTLTILFGSQTGNAKGVAQQCQAKAEEAGFNSTLVSMADYKPRSLKAETHVALFVSTHGEGDAPDDAIELHEFVNGKKAPKLNNTKYAVLGLGDSSYEFFCQTGKDFDERLGKLGGTELVARADCDVDYEAQAESWLNDLIASLKDDFSAAAPAAQAVQTGSAVQGAPEQAYTKKAPFTATLLDAQKITGRDSVKDIRHIEISLEDSGITYKAGDALGVWFKNAPSLVEAFIDTLSLDGDAEVTVADATLTLREALSSKLELTLSYPNFIKAYQAATGSESLAAMMEDKAKLRTYMAERQLIDIVRDHPGSLTAQQLVEAFRPLTPRLYSIASSQTEVEDEVHLTVAHVDYEAFGHRHQGGASGFLCEYLEENGEVDVFVENNDHFRLPDDANTPVIMVGPGTGIAPFRAFMQERDAQDAEGKNWLFFGNPHFTQDFLYQVEWQGYVKDGLLDKITLAFSRDQEEKVYVQHRLLEHGKEVYEWLQQGAHFYVCGDAMYMAKDVENALISIVQQYGEKSEADAKAYLVELRKAKRYQKDVY
ncbi:assimilatory sulfite reductase (NADPH) flavoprotein subunit [Alteromonas sp. CI.11.F.A3]|uniref:assimilatory sulfite reductase (NADPH) flavoprotein subunit n=1 Tax=unclassified Alteromonas TaxID=2614992 RepID=UPI001B3A6092|nr:MULTISPECIES: assimilatory sulfite reductase (NADPH) flavoprotein subunit [unclassified Alteromonas]MBQ4831084.1 assimilatory sulfite reductase (NADPH) flavoprotein subunit [Alteromonas sp. MMG017]WOI38214.1 assimilatory sulfite reductase (NADPH) flavoprotein subunit [Alteromonas sp. CI.11.F.A3]